MDSGVVLVATFENGEHLPLQIEQVATAVRVGNVRTVFVNAGGGGTAEAVKALAACDGNAVPISGDFTRTMLPPESLGLIILGPRTCPASDAVPALCRALADGAELAYGDADQFDARGRRCRPRFKSGFSLDLFLYEDYLSECLAVSAEMVDRLPPWNFADPHSTLLRWLGSVTRIVHVPRIVSHTCASIDVAAARKGGCP